MRGLEKVGGFGGKAAILAEGALYADDPGFIVKQLDWLKAATPAEVLEAARAVMNAGYYQLTVLPFPDYATKASSVDRKAGIPAVPTSPDLTFPAIEEATLKNGLKVVLANRPTVPIVYMTLQFDAVATPRTRPAPSSERRLSPAPCLMRERAAAARCKSQRSLTA